ncbi:MAG: beta-galactosidase [Solirubrobacterales bacterium]|nr:beta-galactosidase [Solirubrobacterales bacterium]
MRSLPNTHQSPRSRSLLAACAIALVGLACLAAPGGANAVPKAPQDFLGVVPQAEFSRLDTQRMKRGKVRHMRIALAWATVEGVRGTYNFDYVDQMFRYAAREGVRLMPTLYGTPGWMSKDWTRLPVANSNQITKWRQFVAAMVKRYGSGGEFWKEPQQIDSNLPKLPVRDWQIWNETNFHYFATPVSPGRYAKLVRASSSVIRNADPRANVVLAGLYARPKGPASKARHADTYLRQLVANVPRSSFDVIAIHPYAADTARLRSIMRSYRNAANRMGLRSKPIYIDEIGWGSGPRTNAFLLGSKRRQATQVKSALNYLLGDRHRLRLRRVYWFAWKDLPRNVQTCSFCYSIGLFEPGAKRLVAKPAWRTFVKFTRGRP